MKIAHCFRCNKPNKQTKDRIPSIFSSSSAKDSEGGIPTLDQVLVGTVSFEPWAAHTFLDFLRTELSEENLYFFEEVEVYKALKGNGTTKLPPDNLRILPKTENDKLFVDELVNTFVKENSPREVNISQTQRSKILEEVRQNSTEPEVFAEAQHEVRTMMRDSWPRFIKKALTENISDKDRIFRLKQSFIGYSIWLLSLGLFLGFLVPRWYFFLLIIPIVHANACFVTFKTKLCMENAAKGFRDIEGSVHARVQINCPIVKMNNRKRARINFAIVIGSAVVMTIASFALTYIVEACRGIGTLYG